MSHAVVIVGFGGPMRPPDPGIAVVDPMARVGHRARDWGAPRRLLARAKLTVSC